MPNIAEKIKSRLITPIAEGNTFKVSATAHFVSETEEARRKARDFHADRATIARAGELGLLRRMWHGLSETYQHLVTRSQFQRIHDDNEDISLNAAFNAQKEQLNQVKAREAEEAQALALTTNLSEGTVYRDNLTAVSLETAGDIGQELADSGRNIVVEYTLGHIDDDQLRVRAEELSGRLRNEFPNLFSRSAVGTDLLFIAQASREAYLSHEGRLATVDLDLELIIGGAGGAFHTQERRDLADRLIDWAQGSRARSVLINPMTIGIGAGLGAWALRAPVRAIPVIGGLASGAFAAVRRWSKENKDRYLKQREEEVGFEIAGPGGHRDNWERLMALAVGRTDFRDFSYRPICALETTERLEGFATASGDVKQTNEWQQAALDAIVQTRVRVQLSEFTERGFVTFGQTRDEGGQVRATGISTINTDKFNLIAAAIIAQRELVEVIGNDEFGRRFDLESSRLTNQLLDEIGAADGRFMRNKIRKAARSGAFAFGVGTVGGFATGWLGDRAEGLFERDQTQTVELGPGKPITVFEATRDGRGLEVEVPNGFVQNFDPQRNLLVLDGPNGRHFEIPYEQGMSEDQIRDSLAGAGLSGDVELDKIAIDVPAHSVQSEILKPEYQVSHGLTEITSKNWRITFGHAEFLARGHHEYNELTLYQHSGTDWSIGPRGLDGSAIPPFVYKQYGPYADPALVFNAPVNREDLVGFVQLKDGAGKWHIMLLDQRNGHFRLPDEFVNPETGKVDAIGIIGYGMVRDANGKIISDQVLSNPDLTNSGTLYSMASIPLEQKARMISEQFVVEKVKIGDLDELVEKRHGIGLPPIPTPWAPRIFPEIAKAGEVPVYLPYGYGFTREGLREYLRSQVSPTLMERPDAILDRDAEARRYIRTWPRNWMSQVCRMNREIGEPMRSSTRAVVAIPVASHQEGKNIYRTLESYTRQRSLRGEILNPSLYEVILLLNRPRNAAADETEAEVNRFIHDHPEFPVHVINRVFAEKQPMGKLRKYLADLAVVRERDAEVGDRLVIVSNDADAINVSDKYLANIIKTFHAPGNAHVDAVLGKIEWWGDVLKKYPVFYASNRFIQFIDATIRHAAEANKAVGSSGANFAFTSDIYSAVGGYDESDRVGEDVMLGTKIKLARAGDRMSIPVSRYPINYVAPAKVVTNPRRGLAKYLQGTPVVLQWSTFEDDDWVREFEFDKPVEGEGEFNVERLEKEINVTIRTYHLSPQSRQVRRALDFLKVGYHVDAGRVKIDDTSRLEAMYRRYLGQDFDLQIIGLGENKEDDEILDREILEEQREQHLERIGQQAEELRQRGMGRVREELARVVRERAQRESITAEDADSRLRELRRGIDSDFERMNQSIRGQTEELPRRLFRDWTRIFAVEKAIEKSRETGILYRPTGNIHGKLSLRNPLALLRREEAEELWESLGYSAEIKPRGGPIARDVDWNEQLRRVRESRIRLHDQLASVRV